MARDVDYNMYELDTKPISKVTLEFEPRAQLHDFVNNKNTIYWLETQEKYSVVPENLVIKGDNLSTMAALRVSWLLSEDEKKFDVIYIDPPYNVGGNKGYKNSWKGESEGNYGWAGDHGKFLDFMEPRLKMAKLLLKDEGVMFISICDAEYSRLLLLIVEIFGESNIIGTFIWDKKQGSPSESINVLHEYIICVAKNKSKSWKLEQLKPGCNQIIDKAYELTRKFNIKEASKQIKHWINDQVKKGEITQGLASYCLIHPITHRVFASNPSCAQDDNGSRCKEPLIHPITSEKCPVPAKGWKWSKDTLFSMVDYNDVVQFGNGYICGKILFGADHTTVPRKVAYLDEMDKQKPPSIIRTKSSGVSDLPTGVSFETPKPVSLIETLVSYIPFKDIRILDFFGGSGTTAHAVESLNQKDGGKRKWVLIEQMESTINNAIIPRMEHVSGKNSFVYYELNQKQAGTVDLLRAFRYHAEEFVRNLHSINRRLDIIKEGIRIIGYNSETQTLVATLSQDLRSPESRSYFRQELACLAGTISDNNAAKVVLYKIETENNGKEEPWVGIKSDIFVGTTCKKFSFVSLPSRIVTYWQETLIALEAV
ncbi:MAG: site-specific DNA-methyltransferase [Desulfitobacteriaceae bacterium]